MVRTKTDYGEISHQEFNEILEEIVSEQSAAALLAIAGVYEVLAEYFNNDILERWDEIQEEK